MSFTKLMQYGGATITKTSEPCGKNFGVLFVLLLFTLLIRAVVVYWGYNALMPTFIETLSGNPDNIKNFRELSFGEALMLVITIQCLLGN